MDKRKSCFIILCVFALCSLFSAQGMTSEKGYYYGVAAGHPSLFFGGLVFEDIAYEIDAGVSGGDFSLGLKKMYNKSVYTVDLIWWEFPVYLGWGARFRSSYHPQFGVTGSVLGSYSLSDGSKDVFLEISPVYRLMPSYGINVDFSVGVKFK